jgi:hypothetical protein
VIRELLLRLLLRDYPSNPVNLSNLIRVHVKQHICRACPLAGPVHISGADSVAECSHVNPEPSRVRDHLIGRKLPRAQSAL